jgi:autotransporter strand-loop-strand O-heptosyltransferase
MFAKTNKQYFHNWKIKVYDGDMPVFDYKLNLSGKRVYIAVDSGSLGDNIAWMPYIDEFRKRHNCHVITSTFKNDLFKNVYPKIEFVTPGSTVNDLFAMYTLGWFYDLNKEPTLPNIVGLQDHASLILGLDHKEIRTKIDFTPSERPYEEKYVVIATSSTAQCKFWNNETGWIELVDYLKSKGYRVINISKEGNNVHNAEMVSDTSMYNTQNVIHHSEFMIGLSSGLSWLSWALGKHVVMLSNFTSADHEFVGDCTRIVNYNVCNGCWNNPKYKFDKSWDWCPVHAGTDRQYECQSSITSGDVIALIESNQHKNWID